MSQPQQNTTAATAPPPKQPIPFARVGGLTLGLGFGGLFGGARTVTSPYGGGAGGVKAAVPITSPTQLQSLAASIATATAGGSGSGPSGKSNPPRPVQHQTLQPTGQHNTTHSKQVVQQPNNRAGNKFGTAPAPLAIKPTAAAAEVGAPRRLDFDDDSSTEHYSITAAATGSISVAVGGTRIKRTESTSSNASEDDLLLAQSYVAHSFVPPGIGVATEPPPPRQSSSRAKASRPTAPTASTSTAAAPAPQPQIQPVASSASTANGSTRPSTAGQQPQAAPNQSRPSNAISPKSAAAMAAAHALSPHSVINAKVKSEVRGGAGPSGAPPPPPPQPQPAQVTPTKSPTAAAGAAGAVATPLSPSVWWRLDPKQVDKLRAALRRATKMDFLPERTASPKYPNTNGSPANGSRSHRRHHHHHHSSHRRTVSGASTSHLHTHLSTKTSPNTARLAADPAAVAHALAKQQALNELGFTAAAADHKSSHRHHHTHSTHSHHKDRRHTHHSHSALPPSTAQNIPSANKTGTAASTTVNVSAGGERRTIIRIDKDLLRAAPTTAATKSGSTIAAPATAHGTGQITANSECVACSTGKGTHSGGAHQSEFMKQREESMRKVLRDFAAAMQKEEQQTAGRNKHPTTHSPHSPPPHQAPTALLSPSALHPKGGWEAPPEHETGNQRTLEQYLAKLKTESNRNPHPTANATAANGAAQTTGHAVPQPPAVRAANPFPTAPAGSTTAATTTAAASAALKEKEKFWVRFVCLASHPHTLCPAAHFLLMCRGLVCTARSGYPCIQHTGEYTPREKGLGS